MSVEKENEKKEHNTNEDVESTIESTAGKSRSKVLRLDNVSNEAKKEDATPSNNHNKNDDHISQKKYVKINIAKKDASSKQKNTHKNEDHISQKKDQTDDSTDKNMDEDDDLLDEDDEDTDDNDNDDDITDDLDDDVNDEESDKDDTTNDVNEENDSEDDEIEGKESNDPWGRGGRAGYPSSIVTRP